MECLKHFHHRPERHGSLHCTSTYQNIYQADTRELAEDVHFKHFHYPPTITNIFSLFCLFSPTIQQYNVKHYLELNVVRLQNYTFINLKLAEQLFYLVSLHIPKIALVDYWHRWPQYLVLDQQIVIRWLCMCPLQVL